MDLLASEETLNFYHPKYQTSHLISTHEELSKYWKLKPQEIEAFEKTKSEFKVSITPYYANLADPLDPNCPIRMQCVPSLQEVRPPVFSFDDPLAEDHHMPVPYLVHRYPDRVLFLLTDMCTVYCRHCTRKRFTAHNERPNTSALDKMIEYIAQNEVVKDVLISGGDPFFVGISKLEYVLENLKKISHLKIIRIGTRVPVTCPMLVTEDLCRMLKKFRPLYIHTHFNHPKEVTSEARKASQMLIDAGMVMGNQTVLLKGINDDAEIIKELNYELLSMGIRPYYLLQCDPVKGSEHFRTPIETGIKIIEKLRGHVSGLAVPHFVIDLPGGGGKVSLLPEYLQKKEGKKYTFKNFQGNLFEYLEV